VIVGRGVEVGRWGFDVGSEPTHAEREPVVDEERADGGIDAICDTFAVNPALLRLRQVIELADADTALIETISNSVQFWSSEDAVLRQLYSVVAIDPAARELVDRQRADRRSELERLTRRLGSAGRLARGVSERRALAILLVLTSYETFGELRPATRTERELTAMLQETARTLLLAPLEGVTKSPRS